MKYSEIKAMKNDELKLKENDFKKEIFNLKIQKSLGALENPKRVKKVKRQIAWIKTLINERIRGEK